MRIPKMKRATNILYYACITFLLISCANKIPPPVKQTQMSALIAEKSPLTAKLIATDLEQLWSEDFDHYSPGLLKDISKAIFVEASLNNIENLELDKLTYYLRIFSSFGPDKDWEEETEENLNNALTKLTKMDDFYTITTSSARLHENYAVALYRLYFIDSLQPFISDHISPLSKLINLYANSELPVGKAIDYALWEVLRASAILPYEARRKNNSIFMGAVKGKGQIQQTLVNFLKSKNKSRNNDNWPEMHALWALSQHYNMYNKQFLNEYYALSKEQRDKLEDGLSSLDVNHSMRDLDNTIWNILSKDSDKTNEQAKTQFSIPYVVSTFRGKSECEEGTLKDRCISPTIEQILPIKHICSDSLYILTQQMTKEQLTNSCSRLISQEIKFHQKLATNRKPVANDFNDKLRVVVFENAVEYNKYGQLVFDIGTDNGGMYIEGTTQDPDNIATFYSYEQFWLLPTFKVWNLNHEYVHYLDGRFIKYDTYNHFPSNLVWWSEGLAEYISKGNKNKRAFRLIAETAVENWPSLMEIFNTEYKDGTDRVYKWSYLGVKFMNEEHKTEYHKMAHFLKTDYFKGYKELIEQIGQNYGDEFISWLEAHNIEFKETEAKQNTKKPRQLYRYTYKNYLKPQHLAEDKHHMHWQYWHQNALNQ